MAGLLLWKQKCLRVRLECVQRGFLSERKGKSFHLQGPKSKAREPTVESLVRGIWRLRVSEAERGEYGSVCKVEHSHRDVTEQ